MIQGVSGFGLLYLMPADEAEVLSPGDGETSNSTCRVVSEGLLISPVAGKMAGNTGSYINYCAVWPLVFVDIEDGEIIDRGWWFRLG